MCWNPTYGGLVLVPTWKLLFTGLLAMYVLVIAVLLVLNSLRLFPKAIVGARNFALEANFSTKSSWGEMGWAPAGGYFIGGECGQGCLVGLVFLYSYVTVLFFISSALRSSRFLCLCSFGPVEKSVGLSWEASLERPDSCKVLQGIWGNQCFLSVMQSHWWQWP